MGRYYRLICLKRSVFGDRNEWDYTSDWFNKGCNICYWKPHYAGYTYDIEEAGLYTAAQLKGANGSHLDWFASPVYLEDGVEE
tara:strand:- start:90 stop:338 length:249 start_codon:yes stop_codon:yes gene_type:complete